MKQFLSEEQRSSYPKACKGSDFYRILCYLALLFIPLGMQAQQAGNQQRITIDVKNTSLQEVLRQVEKSTVYRFTYRDADLQGAAKVTLNARQMDVEPFLQKVLTPSNLSFRRNGNTFSIIQANKTQTSNAQTLRGKVKDSNGEPIIGANVTVKGTSIGTITDIDGNFALEAPASGTLHVSFIGYAATDAKINGRSSIDIILQEDTELLDEVVVVGYGTQRKVDLTGSVQRVNLETVKNAPNASLTSSLQGAIPGLNIGQVNTAGGSASIQVRGQSTLNGSQNVLIVLDGIIYNGTMASINPADVESVDVLKDASSKAIYGASAANGVILITTKKGRKQSKPMINVSMTLSTQSPAKRLHPKNREEKIRSIYDYYWNQGGYIQDANGSYSVNPDFDVASKIEASQVAGYNNGTDYNWLDEGTQDSYFMNYQISLSNSTEKTNFYISGGYTKQEGWVANDSFDRKNVRINLETKVLDWLTIGTRSFGSFMNYSGSSPSLHDLYLYSPMNTPYDESGEMIYIPNGTLTNPFVCFDADDRDLNNSLSALAYASIDVPYIKGLNYRFNWGNNYK